MRNCRRSAPTPPAVDTNHFTTFVRYGLSSAASPLPPAATSSRQAAPIRGPKKGMLSTHAGGGGRSNVRSDRAPAAIASACETAAPMARVSGRRSRRKSAPVITRTASARRFQRRAWTRSRAGHVATTIVVAQMMAGRNGSRMRSESATSARMKSTAKTTRGMSRGASVAIASRSYLRADTPDNLRRAARGRIRTARRTRLLAGTEVDLMTKTLVLGLLVAFGVNAAAFAAPQSTTAAQATPAAKAAAPSQADVDKLIELMRKDVRAQKADILSKTLGLDATQAAAFWPVYKQYEAERAAVNDERVAIIQDFAEHYDSMNDAKAKGLITRFQGMEEKLLAVQKKYVDEFSKVLPGKMVARFFQIDRRVNMLIDLELSSQIPLVSQ